MTLNVVKLKMFGKLTSYIYTSPLPRTANFVAAIRRSGRCYSHVRCVLFAAPADPPCCRFFSAHHRMLRYAARASSDVSVLAAIFTSS